MVKWRNPKRLYTPADETHSERPSQDLTTPASSILTWQSREVVSAFQTYWTSNADYLSAEAASYRQHITVPKLRGNLIPIFHRLGYLDIPLHGIERFTSNGTIHPIFRRENWISDLPYMDHVYSAMLPALRLTTELINSNKAATWWLHVRHGRVIRRPGTDPFLSSLPTSQTNPTFHSLATDFSDFSNRVRFTWLAEPSMEGTHAFSLGSIPGLLQLL